MPQEQITEEKNIPESSAGIYADIQNFREMGKDVIVALVRRWPRHLPKPAKLNLYVRADHTHLWNVWATDQFPKMEVTVKGIQHYSLAATKNAADMAIAVDAISDFNHDRVSHVAVISDDSDFISLYAKIAEEIVTHRGLAPGSPVPFLWVLTDRNDTKSLLLEEFFPERYVHIVDPDHAYYDEEEDEEDATDEPAQVESDDAPADEEVEEDEAEEEQPPAPAPRLRPRPPQRDLPENERIALQLIRDMDVGKFKSTDCQDIIRSNFPSSDLAAADGPRFGIMFREQLLPILETRGVQELGNQKPRQYEMTMEAKRSLVRF